ncbi:MAG: hypothetical protein ACREXX_15055 [Gammaproteobacteria bacterium]
MKPKPIDTTKIPPEVQRRILGFVNAARRPKDLLHPELPRFREDAGRKLIEGRDAAGAFGFTTVKQIFDLDFLRDHPRRPSEAVRPVFLGPVERSVRHPASGRHSDQRRPRGPASQWQSDVLPRSHHIHDRVVGPFR